MTAPLSKTNRMDSQRRCIQEVGRTLSDCGYQVILLEASLVAENPEIVSKLRMLTSAPLILMLGTVAQCSRWMLDSVVVSPLLPHFVALYRKGIVSLLP